MSRPPVAFFVRECFFFWGAGKWQKMCVKIYLYSKAVSGSKRNAFLKLAVQGNCPEPAALNGVYGSTYIGLDGARKGGAGGAGRGGVCLPF